MAPGLMRLPDGRQLRWHEFGEPHGLPVLYTAGTPVSGLGGAGYEGAAKAAGLRWISPDKPGYGQPDFHRQRSLTSWSDDLAALVAAGGPTDPADPADRADRANRANLKASVQVRDWIAGYAPILNTFQIALMRRQLSTPAKRERILRRELTATPEAAEASLRIEIEAVADALRQGTRATVQEVTMNRGAWPFLLSEVTSVLASYP
jgi:hypothetical protein